MKKIYLLIVMVTASLSTTILLNSCSKEEQAVMPSGLTATPKEAGVGELITISGASLNGIQKVMFGDVVALFNPVYNTDANFLLRVPPGTKFGNTTITLINKGGDATKTTIDFKVLQPKPVISSFAPKSAGTGDVITINGNNFAGPNFSNQVTVKVSGVDAKILTIEPTKITFQMPKTTPGKIEVNTTNANGGGLIESLESIQVERIFQVLMDFDGGGPSDKSWFYWSGDTDLTGGFYSNHKVPVPKSGNYAKLGATKGSNKQGYAMIGSDPSVQKWDLTNVTTSGAVLRMDANHNGFKKTVVRFEFSTPSGAFGYTAKIDGPDGWYDLQIPLSEFKNNSGAVVDAKKLGEIKFFLQGYGADVPMEINFDNLRLSAK
jgi:IPT/TIG domain